MIRQLLVTISMVIFMAVSMPVAMLSAPAQAATFGDGGDRPLVKGDADCTSNFLLFPSWYRGLERKGCDVQMPTSGKNGQNIQKFVFIIILNLIDIALRLVGFAAVGFIIYGGFKYLTSAGSPDRIAAGRKVIQNAVIGLVISFFSVAIVNLIAGNLK
jgi:hypothetical protein